MTTHIITVVFILSFGIQLAWLSVYLRMLLRRRKCAENENLPPLSVIICARNEAENLQKFLPSVLNQKYPDFEVVVINDNSEDNTKEVLSEFKKRYNNLTVLEAEKNSSGGGNKKKALTKAISEAKNEILVFTDADCYPVSTEWLKKIASSYSFDTEIIIAYSGYEKHKGFLNRIIRYETLFTAVQYLSFADFGFPYMAVGRNLSYKKSVFLQNKGFESHKNILSGDDDLFINQAANKKNTKIICDFESKTISLPKKTVKEYCLQKRRHFSAGFQYRNRNKLIIWTELMSRFFFYLFLLVLLVKGQAVELALVLFLIRMTIFVFTVKLFALKIKEPNNLFFIPIFDILIPVIHLIILSGTVFYKRIVWK